MTCTDTDMGRLAEYVAERTPYGWRHGHDDDTPVDAAIRMLETGADAWTQLLLVKRALMDADLFTADEVGGDLAERLPSRLAELVQHSIPPPYVRDLLDALLSGEPLDFHRHPVPWRIRQQLDDAYESGRLGVPDPQTARLTEILLAEARDGETPADVTLRLIGAARPSSSDGGG